MNRTILQSIRPQIETAPAASKVEVFQNETLRPILKLQHELLIAIFQHYIEQRKGTFHKLVPKEQRNYIQHSIQKDSKLRELLLGTIIGHFTTAEWRTYLSEEKPIRKRIIDLLVQRTQDGMLG